MVTVLGALLALVLAVVVVSRPRLLPVVIGVAAALPYSTAVVVAGNGVPLFHVAGVVAVLMLVRTVPLRTTHWTANLLVLFAVWAAVITALGPWMFAGTRVLSARGGLDGQVLDPDRLGYTVSTAAQFGYLVIAIGTVLFLVRSGGTRVAVRTAFVVGTVLSSLRALLVRAGTDGLAWLFDTNPTIPYSTLGPAERLRGVFNEPSELAAFSVPAGVFFAVAASRSSGRRRAGWVVLLVLTVVNLLGAGSGTAVAATGVVLGVGLLVLAVRYVLRGGAGTAWLVLGGLVTAIVVLSSGPALWEPVEALVSDKIGSQSWDARTGGDSFAWGVTAETLWLGTGLGGNRPSSFVMSVLSCLGVPGLVLLGAVLIGAAVLAIRSGRAPYGAALLALVIAKAVGTPDLSTPVLWLLLAACVAAAWRGATVGVGRRPGRSGVLGLHGVTGATARPVPAPRVG